MIVVLDASAAIELVLNRTNAPDIQKILHQADYVIAPDLYVSEVTNALWKHAHITGVSLDVSVVDDAVAVPDEFLPAQALYREALAIGEKHGHPVYDCMYLVAARRNSAVLITLDRKLTGLAESESVKVFGR